MDNKFLEEGERIAEFFGEEKESAIAKMVAESLQILSSKHKEDVRALRESVLAATKCPKSEDNPTHRCSALHCNYCGLCPANEDEATGIPKIIESFDSTLKDLGIEL